MRLIGKAIAYYDVSLAVIMYIRVKEQAKYL